MLVAGVSIRGRMSLWGGDGEAVFGMRVWIARIMDMRPVWDDELDWRQVLNISYFHSILTRFITL